MIKQTIVSLGNCVVLLFDALRSFSVAQIGLVADKNSMEILINLGQTDWTSQKEKNKSGPLHFQVAAR